MAAPVLPATASLPTMLARPTRHMSCWCRSPHGPRPGSSRSIRNPLPRRRALSPVLHLGGHGQGRLRRLPPFAAMFPQWPMADACETTAPPAGARGLALCRRAVAAWSPRAAARRMTRPAGRGRVRSPPSVIRDGGCAEPKRAATLEGAPATGRLQPLRRWAAKADRPLSKAASHSCRSNVHHQADRERHGAARDHGRLGRRRA